MTAWNLLPVSWNDLYKKTGFCILQIYFALTKFSILYIHEHARRKADRGVPSVLSTTSEVQLSWINRTRYAENNLEG